jgi:hypothetical protein
MVSKKLLFSIFTVLVSVIAGFVIWQEYTKYQIRSTIQDSFKNAFGNTSTVDNDSEDDNKIEWKVMEEKNIDWVIFKLEETQRFDWVWMETTDWEKLDSAINFKVKVINNSDKDYNFWDYDINLLSKVSTNQVKKIFSMWDTKEQLKPQISSNTIIPWWSVEWYITYYMPSNVQNTDLDLRVTINDKTISYKF